MAWPGVGLYDWPPVELASVDVAVAHAGRATVRHAPGWPPCHQSPAAYSKHVAAVRRALTDDCEVGPQRFRGRAFRRASSPCRISCLDRRTQGRSQRPVLDARAVDLCQLRASATTQSVLAGCRVFCTGAAGEADAGDAPLCTAVARLLAVGAPEAQRRRAQRPFWCD